MDIWTVYDHPKDFPNNYVARRFFLDTPTGDIMVCATLDAIRIMLRQKGLSRLARHENDDPVIVEVWL